MDWLLGRYAETNLEGMDDAALTRFEQLLALPDPELQGWIMSGTLPETSALHDLVSKIRHHNGLGQ
ncbi:MAG: succinate dehydrogenase assembly factor 2 [Hyphomicrobiaceae bacterium]